jgi:Leucine Rich Repeat (LRR) protein
MVEKYGFYVLAASAALGVIGYFWLWIRAFRERVLWGLALLLPPLAILFIWRHFGKARGPALVLGLACVGVAVPYGAAYYERHFVPLQPYEQMVDGELRLTLTGLKDFDYSTLQGKRAIAVLQMANPDVDDQTLRHLQDQDKLRLLDLSDTAITDAGLAKVAELPALRELHLARTKITDEGFREHLMPKATLLKVNLTGTEVKGKTKREWKKMNSEQREYVD